MASSDELLGPLPLFGTDAARRGERATISATSSSLRSARTPRPSALVYSASVSSIRRGRPPTAARTLEAPEQLRLPRPLRRRRRRAASATAPATVATSAAPRPRATASAGPAAGVLTRQRHAGRRVERLPADAGEPPSTQAWASVPRTVAVAAPGPLPSGRSRHRGGRNAERAQHHRQGGGDLLAVAALVDEEELLDRVGSGQRRHVQRVGRVGAHPALQRLDPVVGGRLGAGHVLGQLGRRARPWWAARDSAGRWRRAGSRPAGRPGAGRRR